MQAYIAYSFTIKPKEPWAEILLAALAELPFESFEFTAGGLNAYIPKSKWSENILDNVDLLKNSVVEIRYTLETIASKNWNAQWEAEFSPIQIDTRCAVRAHFHKPTLAPIELIITPRMSFGTGHHETTQMMLTYVLDLPVTQSRVLDMGCGTGILAILASKRGAEMVHGIDNDFNCVANSKENAQQNDQNEIEFWIDQAPPVAANCYDFIFANINKNVLLEQVPKYVSCLRKGGHLILSGFFVSDMQLITQKANESGLTKQSEKENKQWAAIHYTL